MTVISRCLFHAFIRKQNIFMYLNNLWRCKLLYQHIERSVKFVALLLRVLRDCQVITFKFITLGPCYSNGNIYLFLNRCNSCCIKSSDKVNTIMLVHNFTHRWNTQMFLTEVNNESNQGVTSIMKLLLLCSCEVMLIGFMLFHDCCDVFEKLLYRKAVYNIQMNVHTCWWNNNRQFKQSFNTKLIDYLPRYFDVKTHILVRRTPMMYWWSDVSYWPLMTLGLIMTL